MWNLAVGPGYSLDSGALNRNQDQRMVPPRAVVPGLLEPWLGAQTTKQHCVSRGSGDVALGTHAAVFAICVAALLLCINPGLPTAALLLHTAAAAAEAEQPDPRPDPQNLDKSSAELSIHVNVASFPKRQPRNSKVQLASLTRKQNRNHCKDAANLLAVATRLCMDLARARTYGMRIYEQPYTTHVPNMRQSFVTAFQCNMLPSATTRICSDPSPPHAFDLQGHRFGAEDLVSQTENLQAITSNGCTMLHAVSTQ